MDPKTVLIKLKLISKIPSAKETPMHKRKKSGNQSENRAPKRAN